MRWRNADAREESSLFQSLLEECKLVIWRQLRLENVGTKFERMGEIR